MGYHPKDLQFCPDIDTPMIVRKPRLLLDPYEWLPPHGESGVTYSSDGLNVTLTITYENNNGQPAARTLVFRQVCAFYHALFPGPSLLAMEYEEGDNSVPVSSLVEFLESPQAQQWTHHLEYLESTVRHFRICFLAENMRFDILALAYELTEEVALDAIAKRNQ